MKSSPKSNDMPPSAGSKTPASGKKMVQARLPFKTLGGSEPPSNDTSDTVLATANTLTPVTDNRKRKQSATETKADGIRATKINRRVLDSSDDIFLESTEAMESDLSAETETENGTKTMLSRNSESKENVCVGKSDADGATYSDSCSEPLEKVENANPAPKAKHSLEFDGERPEARKSKRNESSIRIKLPIGKKMKKTKKQKKVDRNDLTENEVSLEEGKPQDIDAVEDMNVEEDADADADADETSSSMGSDDEESNHIREKSLLNDSLLSSTSDQCLTPAKMTPKQLQRRIESEKKKEEKELAKLERERKLQEEKEQRQLQKKREREEKGIDSHYF